MEVVKNDMTKLGLQEHFATLVLDKREWKQRIFVNDKMTTGIKILVHAADAILLGLRL